MTDEKLVYHFDTAPYSTHTLLLAQIPAHSRVLEIGAADGYVGEYLRAEKQCEVWGVEPVETLYTRALARGYANLVPASAEGFLTDARWQAEKFDIVLIGDVLEHMVEPGAVLHELLTRLKPGGRVVISLPNVAHYSVRWHLLTGHWDMADNGILDRTHVRFFTRKTARAMIEAAGGKIVLDRPADGAWERFGINKLAGIGQKCLWAWPELLAQQFIFVVEQ